MIYTDTQSILSYTEPYSPTNENRGIKRGHSQIKIRLRLPCTSAKKSKSAEKKDQQKILREYWNKNSKEVVKEQFARDKRIQLQEQRAEIARLERAEKQRLYNGQFIEEFYQKDTMTFELILETHSLTNEILIEVALMLVIHLKQHQIDAVRFLWNQVFESTVQIGMSIDQQTGIDHGGSGALLAHCMGLGKTLTTIVLIHTLFKYSSLTRVHRVLVLCPLNTSINWKNEFTNWLKDIEPVINVYLFSNDEVRSEKRAEYLRHWHENGGVLLMGYEMYRQLTFTIDDMPDQDKDDDDDDDPYSKRKSKKKPRKIPSETELANINIYRKYLRNPGPDLIICDEGHIIKNRRTGIASTLNQIRTKRRIVLTGTPMQNNLKEYYSMIQFCKPDYLGTEKEFASQFLSPIESGQHKNSSPFCVALMKRRIYALHKRIQPIIHRRNLDVLRTFLPAKFEYAIKIRCQPLQRLLYETYIQCQTGIDSGEKLNVTKLFSNYQYLMKIWTHPWLLKPYFLDWYEKMIRKNEKAELENIFADEYTDKTNSLSDSSSDSFSIQPFSRDKFEAMKDQWWFSLFNIDDCQFHTELSGKLIVLKQILEESCSIGDKLLIFSRSLIALDYLEQCLSHWYQWQKGADYFRIDGKTPIRQRSNDMKQFNDTENVRSRVYLISTVAGGVGINLFSANRVIILDTSWNPANDLQAMFRSYRLGQTKPVYIYRLIVKGTMEEKIYKRQITKETMFHRVVDAKQLARHFTYGELAQLYQFDFDSPNDSNDRTDFHQIHDKLLTDLIFKDPQLIASFCEHDSFLIHNDDENLTIEEQNQANDEDKTASLIYHSQSPNIPISPTDDTDDDIIDITPFL